MRFQFTLLLLTSLFFEMASAKDATDPRVDARVAEVKKVIKNFHFVSAGAKEADPENFGVYRGAVPIAMPMDDEQTPHLQEKMIEGVAALKSLGIKTIIDLETSKTLRNAEAAAARVNQVQFISIPLPPLFLRPPASKMEQIRSLLKDTRNYPIYIHCRHGQDRTGMITGFYRVEIEGMNPKLAYQEMLELGFHNLRRGPWEIGYDCYFKEKTGLKVPFYCHLIPTFQEVSMDDLERASGLRPL